MPEANPVDEAEVVVVAVVVEDGLGVVPEVET